MRQIPHSHYDSCDNSKESYFLKIEQNIKIEYLACTLAKNHTQHKTIDMEMIDGKNLRVEVIEHTEQHHSNYLHHQSRLSVSTQQEQ